MIGSSKEEMVIDDVVVVENTQINMISIVSICVAIIQATKENVIHMTRKIEEKQEGARKMEDDICMPRNMVKEDEVENRILEDFKRHA